MTTYGRFPHPCVACDAKDVPPHRVGTRTLWMCGECWVQYHPADKLVFLMAEIKAKADRRRWRLAKRRQRARRWAIGSPT